MSGQNTLTNSPARSLPRIDPEKAPPRSNTARDATMLMSPTSMRSRASKLTVHVGAVSRRVHGWSWQAFPIGMGTGAVYVLLSVAQDTPGRPLKIIYTIFYFLNVSLWLANSATLLLQLLLYPMHARSLVTDPAKGVFVPLIALSFATVVIGTINFVLQTGHTATTFIFVLFWLYVGFSLLVCFPMLMIWFAKPHDLTTFTPAWAFLVFPMMLTGLVASNALKVIEPGDSRAIGVLLTGYIFQGLGFFMTMFYICIYIIRIMTTGFLDGVQAPGAFVACGPPGFTGIALINLAAEARSILPAHNLISPLAGEIWYAGSVLAALFLFGLAVFFFAFGAIPYGHKLHLRYREVLGGWSLTFPNVGWILTLRKLGQLFDIQGFYIWFVIMTVLMSIVWLVLFTFTALAIWKGKIFTASPQDIVEEMKVNAERMGKSKANLHGKLGWNWSGLSLGALGGGHDGHPVWSGLGGIGGGLAELGAPLVHYGEEVREVLTRHIPHMGNGTPPHEHHHHEHDGTTTTAINITTTSTNGNGPPAPNRQGSEGQGQRRRSQNEDKSMSKEKEKVEVRIEMTGTGAAASSRRQGVEQLV